MTDWNEVGPELLSLAERAEKLFAALLKGRDVATDDMGIVVDDLRTAIAKAEELAADPWQPIETAPKDGTSILAWVSGWKTLAIISYSGEAWDVRTHTYSRTWASDPTHWMPLPEPPKETAARVPPILEMKHA